MSTDHLASPSESMVSLVSEPTHLGPDSYLRNDIFLSEDIFAVERARLFPCTWQFVAHVSEFPEVGSFRTVELADTPLILVRTEGDNYRAFINVCRHRCAEVEREPAGDARAFQCFYHLFTYSPKGDLVRDGAPLKGVPAFEGYETTAFRKEDFPLTEVSIENVSGLLFARLDPTGESIDEFLGPVRGAIEEVMSPDLEVFHLHRTDLKTNWKLFSDNNRELYHGYLHYLVRNTLGFWDDQREEHEWEVIPNGHLAFGDRTRAQIKYSKAGYSAGDSLLANPLPGVAEGAARIVYIFPDTMILIRSSVMRIDRMVPRAPGLTTVEFRGLGVSTDNAAERRARQKAHNLVWGPFGRILPEDVFAVESQWRGMASRAVPWSVIARRQGAKGMDDISLRHFYSEWGRRVGVDPATAMAV